MEDFQFVQPDIRLKSDEDRFSLRGSLRTGRYRHTRRQSKFSVLTPSVIPLSLAIYAVVAVVAFGVLKIAIEGMS